MKWLKANNHYNNNDHNNNNNNNTTATTTNNNLFRWNDHEMSIWSSFSIHFGMRMSKFPTTLHVWHRFTTCFKKRKLAQASPLRWHHFASKNAGNYLRRAVTRCQTVTLLTRPFWVPYLSWRCCNSGKILSSVGTHRQWWTDMNLGGNRTTSGFGILGTTQSCAHKFRLRLLSKTQ